MDSMFQQLKKLYDNELYADVIPIVSGNGIIAFSDFEMQRCPRKRKHTK